MRRVEPRRGREWDFDGERRTLAELTRQANRSTVGFDDLARDVEPEAEPAIRSRGHRTFEAGEQAWDLLGFDPDALIAHREDGGPFGARDADLDRLARAVLLGI